MIEKETEKVKEAIIEYARREQVVLIRGSGHKVKVKFDKKLRFPGKNEAERKQLDNVIAQADKWSEVSQFDTTALASVVEEGLWDRALTDEILKYGRIEETGSVYYSKLGTDEQRYSDLVLILSHHAQNLFIM